MNSHLSINIKEVSKKFGNTQALDSVYFSAKGGEIHAILGENGAGKTTLVNIISGVVKPDSGTMNINGEEVIDFKPKYMLERKVATVYQNLSLLPNLTVAENIFINHHLEGIKYNQEVIKTTKLLHQYSIEDIEPLDRVEDLSLSQKQIIEIIKALSINPKILMLDEPTSGLNPPEVKWLFSIVKKLRNLGVCIIFISHRIDEVRDLCDFTTVLRNGKRVGSFETNELSNEEIIQKMLGHVLIQDKDRIKQYSKTHTLIRIKNANHPPHLFPTDLSINKGEILGVAGLAGQGQLELFEILFGIDPCQSCSIFMQDKEVRIKSPIDAINSGIVFLPAERTNKTMFKKLSVRQNMSLVILDMISNFGWINFNQEEKYLKKVCKMLSINYDQINNKMSSLSGGNQQKALLGKWILKNSKLYMLYDPTRGVDIGTKFEILKFIQNMSEEGKTIIYYSTDIDELVKLSHRVIVFFDGEVCDEFSGNEIKSQKILQAVTGIR